MGDCDPFTLKDSMLTITQNQGSSQYLYGANQNRQLWAIDQRSNTYSFIHSFNKYIKSPPCIGREIER